MIKAPITHLSHETKKKLTILLIGSFLLYLFIALMWHPIVNGLFDSKVKNDIDVTYGMHPSPTPTKTPTPAPEQEVEASNVATNVTTKPIAQTTNQTTQSEATVSCQLKGGTYQLPQSWCNKYQAIDASAPVVTQYVAPALPTPIPFIPGQPTVQDLHGLIEKPITIITEPPKNTCVYSSTGEAIGGSCTGNGGGL